MVTTKITDTKTEVSDDNTQIKSTETISNQVKINVFTADGKFISLGQKGGIYNGLFKL